MPTGLPFKSLPIIEEMAEQRLADSALRARQDAASYRGDPNISARPAGVPTDQPWMEWRIDVPQPAQQEIPDPVVLLTQQSTTALDQALAAIGGKRAELQKSIQPEEESAWRDAQVDLRTINESGMDAEQKKQRIRQLQASYEKKVYGIRDKIRGDLEALTQLEAQAKSEVESKRVTTQAKMEAIADFGRKYGLSAEDVAREQLELVGVRMPQRTPAKPQTPLQRLNELNTYRAALEDVALRVRYNRKGQLEEDVSTTKTPQWATVTSPERAAYLENILETDRALGAEIEQIAAGAGRPLSLTDVARKAAVPAPSAGARVWSYIKRGGAVGSIGRWSYRGLSPIAQSVLQSASGGQAAGDDKVVVRNPQGQAGRIPRSQLAEALAKGYTRVR